jgi:hypothetical protein
MKLSILFLLGTALLSAKPSDDLTQNLQVASVALELYRTDKSAEALKYLNDKLRVQGNAHDVTVAEQLVAIATKLHATNDIAHSRVVIGALLSIAESLRQNNARDERAASLFLGVGALVDRVLHDKDLANEYFQAALVKNPDNKAARDAVNKNQR